jgi:hypothetical protein
VKNLAGALAAGALLAGCAWDNSPPPFHSVLKYDPSRAQTFLSNVPPTNAPSTQDWKTNQVAGLGYGSSASSAPPANTAGPAAVGAASSPSGVSTGAATGTAPAGIGVGAAPGTGAPGTIIGSPTGTIIGTTPSAGPIGPSLNPSAQTGPSVGTGLAPVTPLGTGSLTPSPAPSTFTGSTFTNTASSPIFTNTLPPQTNLLPGFSRPTP